MINEKINISFDEVLRYTGFNENIHKLSSDMEEKIKKNIALIKEKAVYRNVISDAIYIEEKENYILAADTIKLQGNDIKAHLKNCSHIVLMAATLGTEVDALIRRTEIIDMSDAVILDAAANVAIEEYSALCEESIREKVRKDNKYLTFRYSPGYGDFPISTQDELVHVLDAGRKIGLYVTPTHIMTPRKSITSIMGIAGIEVKGKLAGCKNCVMKDKCIYRKRGTTCV